MIGVLYVKDEILMSNEAYNTFNMDLFELHNLPSTNAIKERKKLWNEYVREYLVFKEVLDKKG